MSSIGLCEFCNFASVTVQSMKSLVLVCNSFFLSVRYIIVFFAIFLFKN